MQHAVSQMGMPQASKTNICNTNITRYMRSAEPISREMMNRAEPVFWAVLSMR